MVLGGDLVGWHGTTWVKPLDGGRGEALSDLLQVPRLPLQGPRPAAGIGGEAQAQLPADHAVDGLHPEVNGFLLNDGPSAREVGMAEVV